MESEGNNWSGRERDGMEKLASANDGRWMMEVRGGRGSAGCRGTGKDVAGGRTPITVYRVGFHRGVESSMEPGNRLAGRQPE